MTNIEAAGAICMILSLYWMAFREWKYGRSSGPYVLALFGAILYMWSAK